MDIKGSIRARTDRLFRRIEALILKYQRVYLGFVSLFAVTGYLLSLLFPLLFFYSFENIVMILTTESAPDWTAIMIWFAILMFCGLMLFRYIQYKPVTPVGIVLAKDKLPAIFKLVDEAHGHFKHPKIHQIVICSGYETDIVKTPRWGLPLWSVNTLVIGMPMLLCFSPKQFECMLARKIGQFSKTRNPVTNWLYQLRSTWLQYALGYSRQKSIDSKILQWLYTMYAKFYSAVSVYVARRDELNADDYALELHNHEYIREMITADAVYAWFLDKNFWPAMEKAVLTNEKASISPHQQLITALQNHLQGSKLNSLVNRVFTAQPSWNSPAPSMAYRLQNITHDTPHMPERSGVTAASQYLGTTQNTIIKLLDKLWLKNTLKKTKKLRKKQSKKAK